MINDHDVELRGGNFFEIDGLRTSQVTTTLSLSLSLKPDEYFLGSEDRRRGDVRGEGTREGRAFRFPMDGRGGDVPAKWC